MVSNEKNFLENQRNDEVIVHKINVQDSVGKTQLNIIESLEIKDKKITNEFLDENHNFDAEEATCVTPCKNLDLMPKVISDCVVNRFHYDIFYLMLNAFILFGLHSTSLFVSAQPYFEVIFLVNINFILFFIRKMLYCTYF